MIGCHLDYVAVSSLMILYNSCMIYTKFLKKFNNTKNILFNNYRKNLSPALGNYKTISKKEILLFLKI